MLTERRSQRKAKKKIEYQISNPTNLWVCKQKIKRSTTAELNL